MVYKSRMRPLLMVLCIASCADPNPYVPREGGPPDAADAATEAGTPDQAADVSQPEALADAADGLADGGPDVLPVDAAGDAGPDAPTCPSTCFRDLDGDTFGDPTKPQLTCTPAGLCEPGYTTNNTDCYDQNPNARPILLPVAEAPFRDAHRG